MKASGPCWRSENPFSVANKALLNPKAFVVTLHLCGTARSSDIGVRNPRACYVMLSLRLRTAVYTSLIPGFFGGYVPWKISGLETVTPFLPLALCYLTGSLLIIVGTLLILFSSYHSTSDGVRSDRHPVGSDALLSGSVFAPVFALLFFFSAALRLVH